MFFGKVLRSSFFTILLILMGSCSSSNSNDTDSYNLGSACQLPCWEGIIPDQTTEFEMEKSLNDEAQFILDSLETIYLEEDGKEVIIHRVEHVSGIQVGITIEDKIVKSLILNTGNQPTLEQVLGQINLKPTAYILVQDETNGPRICYWFSLTYPELGASLRGRGCDSQFNSDYNYSTNASGQKTANIHQEIPVESVILTKQEPTLQRWLTFSNNMTELVEKEIYNRYEEWDGMGHYPVY